MTELPTVTVAPATYGGWLAICTCGHFRRWAAMRPPVDVEAGKHRSECRTRRKT